METIRVTVKEAWEQKKKSGFKGYYYFNGKKYKMLMAKPHEDIVLVEVADEST